MTNEKLLVRLLVAGTVTAGLFVSCAPVEMSSSSPSPSASTAAATHPTLSVPPGFSNNSDPLRTRIESAINNVRERDLRLDHGFWTIFHGILGLGLSTTLQNPETGAKVNAVDYFAAGGAIRGLEFIPTKYGLDVRSGPQYVGQGHQDQFIAEMGQWNMPADKKFIVNGKEYTFMDFVRHAQMRASTKSNQELSWAICVVGQYMGTDISWTNGNGEKLHFEDMIRYELDQPIESAACGGTHRLFGLQWALYLHQRSGGKATGVWQEVIEKMHKYEQVAKKLQNPDGSFSTEFFREKSNQQNSERRINTTGHTVEWLALTMTDKELQQPWVQEAVNALAQMILDIRGDFIEGGTIYHAAHGLLLYYARVYGPEKLGPNVPYIPLPAGNGLVSKTP